MTGCSAAGASARAGIAMTEGTSIYDFGMWGVLDWSNAPPRYHHHDVYYHHDCDQYIGVVAVMSPFCSFVVVVVVVVSVHLPVDLEE
jgi:hypothetical protein